MGKQKKEAAWIHNKSNQHTPTKQKLQNKGKGVHATHSKIIKDI